MSFNPGGIGSQSPWQRLGLVFDQEFAFVPTPYLLNDETIRLFVAFVRNNIGEVYTIDVAAKDPTKIIGVSDMPCLKVGRPGTFDDNGVNPISIIEEKDRLLMFYTGWQLSDKVRYFLFTGLAESFDKGATFARVTDVPVLDRTQDELIVRTAAYVLKEDSQFRCWYVGGSDTVIVDGKQVPSYSMQYAESDNPKIWPAGQKIINPQPPHEFGFGRPWVTRLEAGGYEMHYSIRRSDCGYRIGYATSPDGIVWRRQDEYGLGVSDQAGEDEMVGFSALIQTKYGKYMFYNGNDYGKSGFFVARHRQTA